jgi:hypothetical protein
MDNSNQLPMNNIQASWIILLLGVLAILVAFIALGNQLGVKQNWEYRIESPSDTYFESEMEAIGNDGWELVFARRATGDFGGASYEMIFKRPASL